jgi:hypothetical protein
VGNQVRKRNLHRPFQQLPIHVKSNHPVSVKMNDVEEKLKMSAESTVSLHAVDISKLGISLTAVHIKIPYHSPPYPSMVKEQSS